MTCVAFLHGAPDRLQAAARWLAAAHRDGQRVLVFVPDAAVRETMSTRLWSEPVDAFIPHCADDDELAMETLLTLTSNLETPSHTETLLNLSNNLPSGFDRFTRIVEIISTAESDRVPGRERFRVYRDRGCAVESNDISGGL